jgi:hypothetical protein
MANTLTGLIPTIYAGLDVVSRELIGFIPNVQRDVKAESGAVGQTVRSPVVPAIATENITAGNTPADSGDQTQGYVDLSISKSKAAPIRWTGEEQLSVTKDGVVNTILVDQFSQAFRALANEVEADIAGLHIAASRAYGTAGTTPFATAADLSDLSQANKILDDNGAPASGRYMIVGSAARANLEGKHSELFKVNEAGDQGALLRQRQMRQLMGFGMGYSAGIVTSTAGTAASATTDNAGYAVGATVITLASAGTGTLVAGDVITFAGDTNKYVVASGDADVSNGGTITLAAPGLRVAMSATTKAITVIAAAARNLFYSRNSLILAARLPAMPEGGDDADDVTNVTDPVSGLTFQVAVYKQYRRIKYEVGLAWGAKCVKPEHCGILLG